MVEAVADDVRAFRSARRVAVNPARACGACEACREGRRNLCARTVMLGSASTRPPTDGAFAELVTVRADQCHALPPARSTTAPGRSSSRSRSRCTPCAGRGPRGEALLVCGAGTIGLLVAMVARAVGARASSPATSRPARRAEALRLAADAALDPADAELAARVRELAREGFDVVVEAAGAPASLRQAFELVRAGGTIVQVGRSAAPTCRCRRTR